MQPAVERYAAAGGKMRILALIENQAPGVGGDHAAKQETSFMLYLHPDLVDLDRLQQGPQDDIGGPEEVINWMKDEYKGHPCYGLVGVDPRVYATAEVGRANTEKLLDYLVEWLDQQERWTEQALTGGAACSEQGKFTLARSDVHEYGIGGIMDAQAFAQDRTQRCGRARNDPRLGWWREARFGLFIHWGLYAVPAGEWKGQPVPGIGEWIMHRARIPVAEYEQLAAQFNPVEVRRRRMGVAGEGRRAEVYRHHRQAPRRLLPCSRRSLTRYNIVDAHALRPRPDGGAGRGVPRQGMRFGFYYSQTQDWHHPDGDGNDWDYDRVAEGLRRLHRGLRQAAGARAADQLRPDRR